MRSAYCMGIALPVYILVHAAVDFVALLLFSLTASLGGVFENIAISLTPLLGFLFNVLGAFLGICIAGSAISRFSNSPYELLRFTILFVHILLVAMGALTVYSALSGVTILPTLGGLLPPLYLSVKMRKRDK